MTMAVKKRAASTVRSAAVLTPRWRRGSMIVAGDLTFSSALRLHPIGSVCFDVVTIFSSVTRIEALRLFLSMLASASSVLHRTGSPFRKGRYDLHTQCTIHMVKKVCRYRKLITRIRECCVAQRQRRLLSSLSGSRWSRTASPQQRS